MGYKVLGFAVWQGGKWYMRRRFSGTAPKAAVIGGGVAVLTLTGVAAVATAQRRSHSD